MRRSADQGALRARVVAGTRVILMALDLDEAERSGLRGFAFSRAKGAEAQRVLRGIKYFADLVPDPKRGADYSTREHPIQGFLWSDYQADPDTEYHFTIEALYGDIGALEVKHSVDFRIRTEKENDGRHGVWFNRGAIASHALATEFHNRQITDDMADNVDENGVLGDEEVRWLSRGLAEACLAFINGTRAGEGLRVCAYEFTYLPVLLALKRAIGRGVDVRIVYHWTKKDDDANAKAIVKAGLPADRLHPRTRTAIPHNKFIVKIEGGQPTQVWTGSTNFTNTGFFGQTNVGHLVTDDGVARTYLDYWQALSGDPTHIKAVAGARELTSNPPGAIPEGAIARFYSPRKDDKMLDWYGQRIRNGASLVILTLPFNVAPGLLSALAAPSEAMRFVILENPPTAEIDDAERQSEGRLVFSSGGLMGKKFVHRLTGGGEVVPIEGSQLDAWFVEEELARSINHGHVFFVHSKLLLIDPLSDDPLICSGSANFSSNSLKQNDENMLLIRGETRVADIYFTEFDRIFRHFFARNAVNEIAESGGDRNPLALDTTNAWMKPHFRQGGYKNNRRLMFFAAEPAAATRWSAKAAQDPTPFVD
jgi:phosphatidylserine/phosphatidylglycerophosphate/cardiolipin synthase-like enzyme